MEFYGHQRRPHFFNNICCGRRTDEQAAVQYFYGLPLYEFLQKSFLVCLRSSSGMNLNRQNGEPRSNQQMQKNSLLTPVILAFVRLPEHTDNEAQNNVCRAS